VGGVFADLISNLAAIFTLDDDDPNLEAYGTVDLGGVLEKYNAQTELQQLSEDMKTELDELNLNMAEWKSDFLAISEETDFLFYNTDISNVLDEMKSKFKQVFRRPQFSTYFPEATWFMYTYAYSVLQLWSSTTLSYSLRRIADRVEKDQDLTGTCRSISEDYNTFEDLYDVWADLAQTAIRTRWDYLQGPSWVHSEQPRYNGGCVQRTPAQWSCVCYDYTDWSVKLEAHDAWPWIDIKFSTIATTGRVTRVGQNWTEERNNWCGTGGYSSPANGKRDHNTLVDEFNTYRNEVYTLWEDIVTKQHANLKMIGERLENLIATCETTASQTNGRRLGVEVLLES